MLILTIAITAQRISLGSKKFDNGYRYTEYNNYRIFTAAWFHLAGDEDLYRLYPAEHWDLYKYSPSFAVWMAPFAYLPDPAGLFLWNLLNVMVLFLALWKLPLPSNRTRIFLLAVILVELVTSIQNAQSNALIAGLIVFAFHFLEKKRVALASLFIMLCVFIKLFGIVAFALFLFYPGKLKGTFYSIGWGVLLAAMPLAVVSFDQLVFLYQSWFDLLAADHSASYGYSVAGWLYSWFNLDIPKNMVLLAGGVIFLLPALRFRQYREAGFRMLFLCSVLVWVVIFNHKAESPTFIIAMTGVAIWFFTGKRNVTDIVLLLLALLFTVLSPTDLFPKNFRNTVVTPYVLKAVPCILVWFKIIYDLFVYGNKNSTAIRDRELKPG